MPAPMNLSVSAFSMASIFCTMAVSPHLQVSTGPSHSSYVAFISDESMDALEAQKDRVYVAPAF
ncbi:hypothetical protein J3R82DRAFT_7638 [Butyriboletus roseoflavus]|nr:hypothetical protein J3R82DRAFT_7638 [Butyriboletus roseoflavus]